MKQKLSLALLLVLSLQFTGVSTLYAEPTMVKAELFGKKKKKFKGYQKPKSKKILGIFKRKSDCGCPNH